MGKILGVDEEYFYQVLLPSIHVQTASGDSIVIVDCDHVDFERTIGTYLHENFINYERRYHNEERWIFELSNGKKINFVMANSLNGNMNMRGYRFSSLTYIRGEVYHGY